MKKIETPDFSPPLKIPPVLGCIRFHNRGVGEKVGFDNNDFSFTLKRDWAYRVLQTELTPRRMEEFKERAYEVLSCFPTLKQYGIVEEPYSFYPLPLSTQNGDRRAYSCLLHSCKVPGIGVTPAQITRLELKIADLSELSNEKSL